MVEFYKRKIDFLLEMLILQNSEAGSAGGVEMYKMAICIYI